MAHRGRAMAAMSLAMLLASLGTSIANVALPTLARALDASFQEVQWIVLAYLLGTTSLVVSMGRLGDIFGRRRLMLVGVGLFTAATVLCAASPGIEFLIAGRLAQGAGAAAMMGMALASAADMAAGAKPGRALGLLGSMSAVGTALGPSLGGGLVAWYGWRANFLALLPLGIACLMLAYLYMPADERETGAHRFDGTGTLQLALALTAYALAMTGSRGSSGATSAGLLLIAVLTALLFARRQSRTDSPLIRFSMLSDPVLRNGLVTSVLVSTVMMATLIVGPFYLTLALELTPDVVGLTMTAGPAVAAVTAAPAGRLVERVGAQRLTFLGLAGIALGCVVLATLPTRFGIPGYLVPIVIITGSYAVFQTANNTAVMATTGALERGVVSGMLNLSRNLGLITGAAVMGGVFGLASGSSPITGAQPAAVAAGMRVTFAVAAVLILAALEAARVPDGNLPTRARRRDDRALHRRSGG